jgi:TonB family protein
MTNKTKGIIGSLVVHILIVVLLIIFGFSTPLPLPGDEGILINFGTDDQGMGMREPRTAPRETSPPPVTQPQPQEETTLTQDFEEAPTLPDPVETPAKPVEKPEPKPNPKPVEEPEPEKEKPREIDRRTLFPGQSADGDTSGEGDGNNQGNQGDPDGSTDSQSREGGLSGGGDGPSFSLDGRKASFLPQPEYHSQESGKVVVKVTVDRTGKVTKVEAPFRGSTNYDEKLVKAAKNAALKARFDAKPDAQAFQTGTITYIFRLRQ